MYKYNCFSRIKWSVTGMTTWADIVLSTSYNTIIRILVDIFGYNFYTIFHCDILEQYLTDVGVRLLFNP